MIRDALVTPLSATRERQAIVAFEDHLLRRFGSAETLRLGGKDVFRVLRATADEVWALVEGAAQFDLEDTRPFSPTAGLRSRIRATTPTRLLLPFGVRLGVRPDPEAVLVRIMSHSEREDPPVPEGM